MTCIISTFDLAKLRCIYLDLARYIIKKYLDKVLL